MAAPMERQLLTLVKNISICQQIRTSNSRLGRCMCSKSTSKNSTLSSDSQDLGDVFMQPNIQQILKRVTGFNLDKIFSPRIVKVDPPNYELLTDKQLEEAQQKAVSDGLAKIQMPPVMSPAVDKEEILSEDPEIANFDIETEGIKYIFTDIASGIKDKDRTIVVREQCGKLRKASYSERNRILHAYFPRPGRMYQMPSMFKEDVLERLLTEGKHEYILDRACVQFEPDEVDFIRVTERTYEHLSETGNFDSLRSTRHFGPMAFYLARTKGLDRLILDSLRNQLLDDAGDLVRLYHVLHPDCGSAKETKSKNVEDPLKLVTLYIQHDAKETGRLELAVQSILEQAEQQSSQ